MNETTAQPLTRDDLVSALTEVLENVVVTTRGRTRKTEGVNITAMPTPAMNASRAAELYGSAFSDSVKRADVNDRADFRSVADLALRKSMRQVGPLSDNERTCALTLFELLDARSDVVHQVLELLETSEKRPEAKDRSKGVNALIGAGMSRVLHDLGDAARDRRGSEVAHIDERGVVADSDEALQVGDGNHDGRDDLIVGHTGLLQGVDQLLRVDEVRPGREILKTGVTHNSSPSVDDAGAHSVGDGPGAGDASATPATWVTEGKLAKRLHDSVVRKSEALGRVEKVERRLFDAREDLAHAENEQREASAAYDAFIFGGSK